MVTAASDARSRYFSHSESSSRTRYSLP